MQISLIDNLPFVSITISYQGQLLDISQVLLDTGSGSTILAADRVAAIHIQPKPEDMLYVIRGVGGGEVVYSRRVDYLQLGSKRLENFDIEVGGMDYGFAIDGILGMDFLKQAEVIINLSDMEIDFAS